MLRRFSRRVLHYALDFLNRPKSRRGVHRFWRGPDTPNRPGAYLGGEERSRFLVDLVRTVASPDARILELGCNVGRNLHFLHRGGFRSLHGIEINEKAVALLRAHYPELAQAGTVYNAPIEDVVPEFEDGAFDVVFSMATLEHLHTDSEWVFPHLARITRGALITVEDEHFRSERHFPRNYGDVFAPFGLREAEAVDCSRVEGLGESFRARVFRKVALAQAPLR